jgi:hypothetical protein
MNGPLPESLRLDVERKWLAFMAEVKAANALLPPCQCLCGRGLVVSFFGCRSCKDEGAAVFLAELETWRPRRERTK